MNVGNNGLASQVASAQRPQHSTTNATKQPFQAQTFASLIAQTPNGGSAKGITAPQPVGTEQKQEPLPDQGAPDRRLPRGSLVNILA